MSEQAGVNIWMRCGYCGMSPIVGPCFRCETCPLGPEIDLCSACYEGYRAGRVPHPEDQPSATHVFSRIEPTPATQFAQWLSISSPSRAAPSVPAGFLVRPEFRYGRESVFGGYAFVARYGTEVVLLTALHVMDELIKNKKLDTTARNPQYTGKELPAQVTSVRLYDVLKERWALHELGDVGPMLVLPNARTADDEPFAARDIAAFRVDSPGTLHAAPLAERDPEPGDPVWLAAAMPDGSRTRRAVCVESTPRSFIFRYDETKPIAKHSSGAPILDSRGDVVGINTGLGALSGRDIGHANPVSSIRAHLGGALTEQTSRWSFSEKRPLC